MTDKQITDKFEIKCKNCGSTDIEFSFYSGYVYDCGGEVGSLYITCKNCGNEYGE